MDKKFPRLIHLTARWFASRIQSFPVGVVILVIIELSLLVALLVDHRIPLHDSFSRLSIQYFLMNNAVASGEFPQWNPYLTHGATVLPWYGLYNINGLFLYGLFILAGFLKPFNFLIISYGGIFVDELILLCGTLLLANRFLSSRLSSTFVALSVWGSSIWLSQSYFNLHLIYGVPLLLYLFHRWLEKGRWTYFFWGLSFFVIQSLGQLAYFLPVVLLVISIYITSFTVVNTPSLFKMVKKDSWEWRAWIPLFLFLFSSVVLLWLWHAGIRDENIVRLIGGRNPDGAVTLQQFLSYRGEFNGWKFFELVWGISVERDYTLYIGAVAFVFLIAGFLWGMKRQYVPIFSVTLFVFLLCAGTFVATVAYWAWPMMKFYRHLHLLVPIVRLFLCFIAGIGLEAIMCGKKNIFNSWRGKILWLSIVAIIFILCHMVLFPGQIVWLGKAMGYRSILDPVVQQSIMPFLMKHSVSQVVKFILILGALILMSASRFYNRRKILIGGLVILSCIDIYSYKYGEYMKRSVPLIQEQYEHFRFQPLSYQARRQIFDWNNSPRFKILMPSLLEKSAVYWTLNAFMFNDTLDTPFRTDYWQKAFADYLGVWDKDVGYAKNLYHTNGVLGINPKNDVLNKLSGVSEDKIQFFNHAYVLEDMNQFKAIVNRKEFLGDNLFLLIDDKNLVPAQSSIWSDRDDVGKNRRLSQPYQVTDFQANGLQIVVDVKNNNPIWMFYSDVWAPQWKVKVNGVSQPVYRAQLAYKAVLLQPGRNVVDFYYGSPITKISLNFLAIQAWGWIIFCLISLWRIGRTTPEKKEVVDG